MNCDNKIEDSWAYKNYSFRRKYFLFPLAATKKLLSITDSVIGSKTEDWYTKNCLYNERVREQGSELISAAMMYGLTFAVISTACSLYNTTSISRGDMRGNGGLYDDVAIYVTGIKPYKTDIPAAKEICDSIIRERISRCDRIDSADDIIKILKNIDTGKIAQSMNGYNEKTCREKAVELVNNAISEAINKVIKTEIEKLELQEKQLRENFKNAKETLRNDEPTKPTSDAATKAPGFTISRWKSYQPVANKAAGKAA